MLLMNRVADVIVAACCLHNFLIQFGEGVEIQDEEQFPADDEVDEDAVSRLLADTYHKNKDCKQ